MSRGYVRSEDLIDDPSSRGVRRRIMGLAATAVLMLVAAALVKVVFAFSGSIWFSMATAALCGIAFMKIGTPFDPPVTRSSTQSDKIIWLVLFIPALLVLTGTSIYEALYEHSVYRASASAGLFGAVLGGTLMVLFDADSRAGA